VTLALERLAMNSPLPSLLAKLSSAADGAEALEGGELGGREALGGGGTVLDPGLELVAEHGLVEQRPVGLGLGVGGGRGRLGGDYPITRPFSIRRRPDPRPVVELP
jgi:hypothetical protein